MARGFDLDRRSFLVGAAAALLLPQRSFASAGSALPAETLGLLDTSEFVYVTPLRSDGAESTCHGEVWYGWLDGTVVINTRRGTWKVAALEKGLDRARIWVGNHGRWKRMLPGSESNEAFRKAPSFEAKASFETDRTVNERLLALYETKYAAEFGRWREDMQAGFFSGKRRLIRYTPAS